MPLKPEKYRDHFDGLDLTDEQKTAMCEAICTIAEAFADLGFGIGAHPHFEPANDNDSPNKSNVINLFEQSATNPTMESKTGPDT